MSKDLAVILPAGGTATRFGSNKLLAMLDGKTVQQRSADAFLDRKDVGQVVIATSSTAVQFAHSKLTVCEGGSCRALTVLAALKRVPTGTEWIAIHDAARPLVSPALIDRVFAAARDHGAAGPALPVALTIKQSGPSLPGRIERTVPRSTLWAMQTPQVMRRADLLEAFDRCPVPLEQITDDLQLLELIGKEAWLVEGEERNLKITTPLDLEIARLMWSDAMKG